MDNSKEDTLIYIGYWNYLMLSYVTSFVTIVMCMMITLSFASLGIIIILLTYHIDGLEPILIITAISLMAIISLCFLMISYNDNIMLAANILREVNKK